MLKLFFLENAPLAGALAGVAISGLYYAVSTFFAAGGLHFWLLIAAIQALAGFFTGVVIRKLLQQSFTDPLTGFYNRRFFYHQLERESDYFHRYKIPLSLAIVDVDDFKTVNDRFGHITGDKVLKTVSGILKNSLRKTDIISRWGGEEFAIILSGTGLEDAKIVVERLRKHIEKTVISDPGLNLTVSVGIASLTENMKPQELLLAADSAMYSAKKLKNKVVIFSKELADLPTPVE